MPSAAGAPPDVLVLDLRIREITARRWQCPRRQCRHQLGPGYIYLDGDTLDIESALGAGQAEPDGFDASYATGTCPACRHDYFAAVVTMIDGDVDDDFRDHWLWHNKDMGAPRRFEAASRGTRWHFD